MQGKKNFSETRQSMALPLGEDVLTAATEGMLLRLAQTVYEIKNPGKDGKLAIADHLGRSIGNIGSALKDETHIGTIAWLRVEGLIGIPLFREWLKCQLTKVDE